MSVSAVDGMGRLHNGSPRDYVTWSVVGTTVLAGAFEPALQ
jgi:hypothetical protein